MNLLKLCLLLLLMLIILIYFGKPMWVAALCAVVASVFIFGIAPSQAPALFLAAITSQSTLEILAVLYLVNLLQTILQTRGDIRAAEDAMQNLFRNRRAIAILSPILMGLLPAPNAVLLSAPMVDGVAGDYLDKHQKAFLTSYYRHIPEAGLPLYSSILLTLQVTGVSAVTFFVGILPLMLVSVLIPHLFLVRKIPSEPVCAQKEATQNPALSLFKSLFPIFLLLAVSLFTNISISTAALCICLGLFVQEKASPEKIWFYLKKAFSAQTLSAMALTLVLKDFIISTNVISALLESASSLPIPQFLIYAFAMFFAGFAGLTNAGIAILLPVVFHAGVHLPTLVLIMGFTHGAIQLSPTHVCLEIATGYFKSDYKHLVLKTIPVVVLHCAFALLYYFILS